MSLSNQGVHTTSLRPGKNDSGSNRTGLWSEFPGNSRTVGPETTRDRAAWDDIIWGNLLLFVVLHYTSIAKTTKNNFSIYTETDPRVSIQF